jgi:benzoyl-CoA reductase subunit BamC
MCEGEEKPKCVEVCLSNVLVYEEREEEVEEEVKVEEVEAGVGSLIDKYGLEMISNTVARLAQKA